MLPALHSWRACAWASHALTWPACVCKAEKTCFSARLWVCWQGDLKRQCKRAPVGEMDSSLKKQNQYIYIFFFLINGQKEKKLKGSGHELSSLLFLCTPIRALTACNLFQRNIVLNLEVRCGQHNVTQLHSIYTLGLRALLWSSLWLHTSPLLLYWLWS